MISRADLHAIVDDLPDTFVEEAGEVLRDLATAERLEDGERAALDDGLAEARRGEGRPLEDVLRDLRL